MCSVADAAACPSTNRLPLERVRSELAGTLTPAVKRRRPARRSRATFKSKAADGSLTPQAATECGREEIDLIAVREADEWPAGHKRGARHIPLGQPSGRLADPPYDRPVAFVCRSGERSKVATGLAARQGVEAHNVNGSLEAWQRAGLDLTNQGTKGNT